MPRDALSCSQTLPRERRSRRGFRLHHVAVLGSVLEQIVDRLSRRIVILGFKGGIFASQLAQLVRSSLLAYGSQASAPELRQLRDIADAAGAYPPYETRMANPLPP